MSCRLEQINQYVKLKLEIIINGKQLTFNFICDIALYKLSTLDDSEKSGIHYAVLITQKEY